MTDKVDLEAVREAISAAVEHLIDNGRCEDAHEDDPGCEDPDCTYCLLAALVGRSDQGVPQMAAEIKSLRARVVRLNREADIYALAMKRCSGIATDSAGHDASLMIDEAVSEAFRRAAALKESDPQ
jgi:hypothetical protein